MSPASKPQTGETMSDTPFSGLEMLRRFYDAHWPARLTPTQSLIWIGLLRHANSRGEAWPSAATLARYLGKRSIERVHGAKSELVRLGLLSVITPGGGKHRTTRFRLQVPVAKSATVAETATVADSEGKPLHILSDTVAHSASKPLQNMQPEEEKKNTEKNTLKGDAPDVMELCASLLRGQASEADARTLADAWRDWLEHRREQRRPLTPRQQRAQLQEFSTDFDDAAHVVRAVRAAIAGGKDKPYPDSSRRTDHADRTRREYPERIDRTKIPGYPGYKPPAA